MRKNARVISAILVFSLCATVQANKYGSVEPIANSAVIDTTPLRDQPLRVERGREQHEVLTGQGEHRRIGDRAAEQCDARAEGGDRSGERRPRGAVPDEEVGAARDDAQVPGREVERGQHHGLAGELAAVSADERRDPGDAGR